MFTVTLIEECCLLTQKKTVRLFDNIYFLLSGVFSKRQQVGNHQNRESTTGNNILHNDKLTGNLVNNKQYDGDKTQSNYIGDDMEGDIIEHYNGDKTVDAYHLRGNSSSGDNEFAAMNNLEEYQGFPNEADVVDKSSSSLKTRDKKKNYYSTLRTMKDAIAVDDTLIDNELKALDQEDLRIGKAIIFAVDS